jgi:tetratricopeptide (TPR) repeat protein
MGEQVMFDFIYRSKTSFGAVLAAASILLGLTACERSPEQKLKQAQVELVQGNPKQARSYLKDIVKAKPDSVEAKRLMSDVQNQLGNYAKAEQMLDDVWKQLGLDDKKPSELSSALTKQKKLLKQQYEGVYESWAKSLDPKKDTETYGKMINRAVEMFPEDTQINDFAFTYYEAAASTLADKENYKKAAEKMKELSGKEGILAKTADKADRRANDFLFQIHKEDALKYFNENAKANLEENDLYDPENEVINLDIEQKVNKKLDPENQKHKKAAKALAIKAMGKRLQQLLVEATGLPKDTDFSGLTTPDELEITEESFEPGVYKIKAKLPVEALLRLGFDVKQAAKQNEGEDN